MSVGTDRRRNRTTEIAHAESLADAHLDFDRSSDKGSSDKGQVPNRGSSGTVGDQPALVLTHRRRKDAQVTISYQQSLDLADPLAWTPVAATPVVIAPDADGDGLVELVAVSVPLPAEADPRLFLRVVVTE